MNNKIFNKKLVYFYFITILSLLLLSASGCVTTPIKLDDNFYNSIRQVGTEVDSIFYFKLPNGISVYIYKQPKNENDSDSSNLYQKMWISYIFNNLAIAMSDLPAGTQYALADILYYIAGAKYDADKFESLYKSGYLSELDYQMTEDYYRLTIAASPSYFNTLLTDIPVDIIKKSIPKNINYQELAKSYSQFLKKKEYDPNWLAYRLAEQNAFQNTAYSFLIDTPSSYSRINEFSVSKLYKRLIQPKNLTIIIRGSKISAQAAANILWEKFSFLKNSNQEIDSNKISEVDPSKLNKKNFSYAISKDSKNSLVACYFPGPVLDSKKTPAFIAALNILGKKLFIDVRIKNNCAYQIDVFPYLLKQIWGNILYNTNNINFSMQIIRKTIQNIRTTGISDDDLNGFKNFIFTTYYLYQSYGINKFRLFFNSITQYNEDLENFYVNYLKTFQNLCKENVNDMIKNYFNYFYWGIVTSDESNIKNLPKELFFYNP
ncbi:MAG: insulinase family protein [Exilispira sp.]